MNCHRNIDRITQHLVCTGLLVILTLSACVTPAPRSHTHILRFQENRAYYCTVNVGLNNTTLEYLCGEPSYVIDGPLGQRCWVYDSFSHSMAAGAVYPPYYLVCMNNVRHQQRTSSFQLVEVEVEPEDSDRMWVTSIHAMRTLPAIFIETEEK